MRREAAGLEPRLAPDALTQRRELAEMGGALDGAALEAEFLRGRVVMDRRVGIVGLRMQHLLRRAPWSLQHAVAVGNFGVEWFHLGLSLKPCLARLLNPDDPGNQAKMHIRYEVCGDSAGRGL